jgi:hypothetical protein
MPPALAFQAGMRGRALAGVAIVAFLRDGRGCHDDFKDVSEQRLVVSGHHP